MKKILAKSAIKGQKPHYMQFGIVIGLNPRGKSWSSHICGKISSSSHLLTGHLLTGWIGTLKKKALVMVVRLTGKFSSKRWCTLHGGQGINFLWREMTTSSKRLQTQECLIRWIPPPEGHVKVNVDGASGHNLGKAAARELIRDDIGRWLGGFSENMGVTSNISAKLWAILTRLKFAWDTRDARMSSWKRTR